MDWHWLAMGAGFAAVTGGLIVNGALTVRVVTAAEQLVDAVTTDNGRHGGLITRETIRAADELRALLLAWRRVSPGADGEELSNMAQETTYTVARRFKDSSGRQWEEGDAFEEADEKAIAKALREGNIREGDQATQQPAGGQKPGQGGQGGQPKA